MFRDAGYPRACNMWPETSNKVPSCDFLDSFIRVHFDVKYTRLTLDM